MNRLLVSLALVGAALSGAASARDLKTMHSENDLPRPAGVEIAGARADQVTLYCTQISAGCKGLRDHLRKTGIDFVDKDPKTDPAAGAEFDALGGQGVPLVVFKQRLMHGYYPSSFDRLYAQYHAGTKAAPVQAATPAVAGTGKAGAASAPAKPAASETLWPTKADRGCIHTVGGSGNAPYWLVENQCGGPVELKWCWHKSFKGWRNPDNVCAITGVRSSGPIQNGARYEFPKRPHSDPSDEFPAAAALEMRQACRLDPAGACKP